MNMPSSRILRRSLAFLVLLVGCALFASGCEDLISDPNFHTWCGDQLCSWKLESGQIRKAPTWHPKDLGVELLDGTAPSFTTAISQVAVQNPKCLQFSVVGDVAPEAQVSVQVDFDNDGLVEYEQQIAAVGFREQRTQITAPPYYANIKFTIIKKGTGKAVLAQMDVRSVDTCTAAPVKLKSQPLGLPCATNGDTDQCQSGVCCDGLCAECCVSDGVEAPDLGDAGDGEAPPPGPVDPLNHCSDGAACGRLPLLSIQREGVEAFSGIFRSAIPYQCDPGHRQRPAGAECLVDQDCSSGTCEGEAWSVRNIESDAGPPCPAPPEGRANCNVFGVRGGRCR
ncbi:MAG: hypothetical protein JWP97_6287 [Labilithrix sp.]|nr:hypothetical protein [Labilithrix sp.]